MQKFRWKNLFSGLAVVAVFSYMAYFLARDWQTIIAIRWWRHPWLMGAHFACLILAFGLFVKGWQGMLQGIGFICPLGVSAATWLVPNLGKYIPGKILMFAGRIEFCHRRGLPRGICFGAMVFEHIVMILAALPCLVLAFLTGAEMNSAGIFIVILILAALILSVFVWPGIFNSLLNHLLKLAGQKPVFWFQDTRKLFKFVPIYFLLWMIYGLSGWFLMHAMGLNPQLPVFWAICSFVAAWLVGFLAFLTPGGLGVRELTLVGLLSQHIPASQTMVLAILARLTWTVVELIGVLIGIFLSRREPRASIEKIS